MQPFSDGLKDVKLVLFDWGDTLMRDLGIFGPMSAWETVHVFPDVPGTLEYLSAKYTLGVATNAVESSAGQVHRALERGAIGKFFRQEHIFTAADLPWRKPRPEFFQHIMSEAGLSESELCMVGDSFGNDVEGVARLGIPAIWLNRGGTEIRRSSGYSTVFSLLELKTLL